MGAFNSPSQKMTVKALNKWFGMIYILHSGIKTVRQPKFLIIVAKMRKLWP